MLLADATIPGKSRVRRDRLVKLVDLVVKFYDDMQAKERNETYAAHHLDHVLRVVGNVKSLAESMKQSLNIEAALAAALCHDLAYGKDMDNHPKISAEMSVKYLRRCSFSTKEISEITKTILAHSRSFRMPQTLEEKVLYVADKLDLIGYDGVVRDFIHVGRTIGDRDEVAAIILSEIERKVKFMLSLGIGRGLINKRWDEARSVLLMVLRRKPSRNIGST